MHDAIMAGEIFEGDITDIDRQIAIGGDDLFPGAAVE